MVHAEMVFHTIKKINMQNNVMDTGVFAFVSSEHYSVDYSEDNTMAVAALTESVECKGEPSRFCLELTLEGVFLLDGVKSKAQKEEAHRKCYDSLFPVAAQLVQSLTAGCGADGGIKIQKRSLKHVNFGAEPEERNGKIIDFPLDR